MTAAGSSPLARGLLCLVRDARLPRRIIPARAGFTSSTGPTWPIWPDHPRSRGVYVVDRAHLAYLAGSSPLARGLRTSYASTGDGERIIPARAGFTTPPTHQPIFGTDHPRSRGVYRRGSPAGGWRRGSSPLARGLLLRPVFMLSNAGIIPARAGFTRSRPHRSTIRTDHPRSRGVYSANGSLKTIIVGSSPLARGLPPAPSAAQGRPGIIPARAGFTRAAWRR